MWLFFFLRVGRCVGRFVGLQFVRFGSLPKSHFYLNSLLLMKMCFARLKKISFTFKVQRLSKFLFL